MQGPVIITHNSIAVVRDDLFPGGTKARYLAAAFDGRSEVVYASPAEGGAQTALATVARSLGKRVTIFVAKRATPHPRAEMVRALGGKIIEVPHGYLNVVKKRAKDYCAETGAWLLPFGGEIPGAIDAITYAAGATGQQPDEVWCAAGSGLLARALAQAWPLAKRHVVQVGRALTSEEVMDAQIHVAPIPFGRPARHQPPFPSDPHYDAKAWWMCQQLRGSGKILFWNVTGPAS